MTLASEGSIFPSEGATNKAQRFLDRGRDVADTANLDYATELFIHGLSLLPDDVSAHKELRLIALQRKARGGQDTSITATKRTTAASTTCASPAARPGSCATSRPTPIRYSMNEPYCAGRRL